MRIGKRPLSKTILVSITLLGTASLFAVMAVSFFGAPSPVNDHGVKKPTTGHKRKPLPARSVMAQAAERPVTKSTALPVDDPELTVSVPPECRAAWEKIAYAPLQDFDSQLKDDAALGKSACVARVRKTIQDGQSGLDAALVRAVMIDALSGSSKNPARFDTPTLMNKIVGRFVTGRLGADDLEDSLALADELVRREPALYAAHKAKVAALAMRLVQSDAGEARTLVELQAAIADCRSFDVKDPEVDEAEVLPFALKKDWKALESHLRERMAAEPDWPIGNYYLAMVEWKAGRREGALAALERATRVAPEDTRFAKTLDRVKTEPLGTPKVFSSSLSFGFKDI